MTENRLTPWLLEKIQNGEAVLFLGAGVARGATDDQGRKPPDGNQLRDLIADRFLGGALKDKPLPQVAEYAKYESSLFDVQSEIYNIFSAFRPAAFHALVARFRWHSIVTTNYDLIVERAYQLCEHPLQNIEPIHRDDDNFSRVIGDPGKVPFLKLHGCITTINDPSLPLILSTEEYARHRKNRDRLFSHLQDWGREHPIIFCGYDVSDPNIQQILFDLGDGSINRPTYSLVRPDLSDFEIRYWSARRFVTFKDTFERFLVYLENEIPSNNRVLSGLRQRDAHSIQPWVARGTPTDSLLTYLSHDLVHVTKGLPHKVLAAEDFYAGTSDSWGFLENGLDVWRRVTDDIMLDAVIDPTVTDRAPRFFVLKGYAGSGKSVTLRRTAWEAAYQYGRLVLWAEPECSLREDLLYELYNVTNERTLLIVDDVLHREREIRELLRRAHRNSWPIDVIGGARTNEWNISADELDPLVNKDYELRDLTNREVSDFLEKLENTECLGHLKELDEDERRQFFALSADRQLLVALHEATSGKSFEEIVLDEYKNVGSREAQALYLDICTLHRFGVGVRAGLISRVSGITMPKFQEEFFRPLEHLVLTYFDVSSRDYAYRTRHSIIADFVFREALTDQEERARQIIRIVRCMNVDYESDRVAFEQLIKGKGLADLFSDRILPDQIFEAALKGAGNEDHIRHQRAVFELNHPGGSTRRALQEVDTAIQSSTKSNRAKASMYHTKAMVLRRSANEAESALEKEKLRDEAKELLDRQIQYSASAHPFHAKGQILLDELKERISRESTREAGGQLGERVVYGLIKEIEGVIGKGVQRVPGESYLLGLEADFKEVLRDSPGALRAVEAAFEANKADGVAAIRLAKAKLESGDTSGSKKVLAQCIELNPNQKSARAEYAKILIREDEKANAEESIKQLRSSFADGDSNYDTQFWYARQSYLYGDRNKSEQTFERLAGARVSPTMRRKVRGVINGSNGGALRFEGIIATMRDSYCFVRIPVLGADVFVHHSEFAEDDWLNTRIGRGVSVKVGFSFRGPVGVDVRLDAV